MSGAFGCLWHVGVMSGMGFGVIFGTLLSVLSGMHFGVMSNVLALLRDILSGVFLLYVWVVLVVCLGCFALLSGVFLCYV